MITQISVSRSAIGNSILQPVQRSDNAQLAINNSDHLVLIEPRLPFLHQCISSKGKKGAMVVENAGKGGSNESIPVKIELETTENESNPVKIEPTSGIEPENGAAEAETPKPEPENVLKGSGNTTNPSEPTQIQPESTETDPNENESQTAENTPQNTPRSHELDPVTQESEEKPQENQGISLQAEQNLGNSSNYGENDEFVSSSIFSCTSIFQTENLESLGFQFFSRLYIEDKENRFNFGRIQEPLIVSHKWSPVQSASRDCYLGLLLNTGEVMVLQRETLDASGYTVKFRTFTSLLDQLCLSGDRLTSDGDIIVSGMHFSELRLTDFSFGGFSEDLVLFLAHESGDISIHQVAPDLPQLHRFKSGGLVVLSAWCTGALYYALSDNSVYRYDLGFEMSYVTTSGPVRIKDPSRFLVSNLVPFGNVLVVTDTAYMYVIGPDAPASARLPYNSVLCGLPIVQTQEGFVVYLSFENGRFGVASYDWDTCQLTISPKCPILDAFSKQTLNRYSGVLAKEQARAPWSEFAPYLDNSASGNLTVHGTTLWAGYLVVVYSLAPRNVISHVIKSKKEYSVSFVPIDGETGPENDDTETISQILLFLLETKSQIPFFDKKLCENDAGVMETFGLRLNLWKSAQFQDPNSVELSFTSSSSLTETLAVNFKHNSGINELQRLYVLNHTIVRTLYAVQSKESTKTASGSGPSHFIVELEREQNTITQKIRSHLAHILLSWAQTQQDGFFTSDFDKFILNTYQKLVATVYTVPIVSAVILTVSGELCTEKFEVSRDHAMEQDFLEVIRSTTHHTWPRCSATLLPILGLTNKTNELGTHNYLTEYVGDSCLAQAICSELDYCIYTGTRTFELKKGV